MFERELEVAREAVEEAARLCARIRRAGTPGSIKKVDGSPVTVADFASQFTVVRSLQSAFPGDPVIAEERSDELRRPENRPALEAVARACDADADRVVACLERGSVGPARRLWTLDPIDGTKGYIRGGHFAVALALVEDGQVSVSVLGCPTLPLRGLHSAEPSAGVLLWAARGSGAWQAPLGDGGRAEPIRVAQTREVRALQTCESVEPTHSRHDLSERIARELGIEAPPLRIDSQAKYALVARGDADAYWRIPLRSDNRENIWDHAPGSFLVEEAGGVVSDLFGASVGFWGPTLEVGGGILATNGFFHPLLVEALTTQIQQSECPSGHSSMG